MADEVDGGQRADTADGGPRWVGPAIFIGAPVVAAIVVVAWFFGWGFFGADHPFGDERACAGSDVPLQPALEDAGIALPADATGVHYLTRSAPQDGQARLALTFRSSREAVRGFLSENNLPSDGFDQLRAFSPADAAFPDGLCGKRPEHLMVDIPKQLPDG